MHPLAKHVSKTSSRYVKRHRALVHEITHAFNIWPDEFEVINLVRFSPKWSPKFPIQVSMSRPAAMDAAQADQADMRVYSDGSGIYGNIRAATMLYRDRELKAILKKNLGEEDGHMVFEPEVVGLSLVTDWVEKNICMVTIGSDSQAAIWETRSTRGVSGQHLVDKGHERVEAAWCRHRGLKIKLRWTPGMRGS